MAIDLQPGKTVRVTINKNINRAAARKTLERLFMSDKAVSKPIERRSRNFIELPKRRGGQMDEAAQQGFPDPRERRRRHYQDDAAVDQRPAERGRLYRSAIAAE